MNQEGALACCAVCSSKTVRRCSRCLSINYCNKEHQRQDWKRHKPECIPKTAKQGSSNNKNGETSTSSTDVTRIRDSLDRLASGASSDPEPREPSSATSDTRRLKKTKNKNLNKEGSVSEKQNSVNSRPNSVNSRPNSVNSLPNSVNSRPNSAVLTNNSVISSVLCDNKDKVKGSAITYEGSSEQDILSETAQQLTAVDFSTGNSIHVVRPDKPESNMLAVAGYSGEQTAPMREYPEATLQGTTAPFTQPQNSFLIDPNDRWYDICQQVIRDMTQYGLCVLDNFLGKERGHLVLKEVLNMYKSGIFQAGQLVSNPSSTEAQTVRSDRITWIDGKEPYCYYINKLISQVDNIILRANKMANNGKLGDYTINGRTRAMVACYPGCGTHYVKHVDNPNKDGRCITAIYYLNLNYDKDRCGGMLRVFPEGTDQVADIMPFFDRMIFFWSDRRNPHEVQPAFVTRYAITLWYFDAKEREEALKRHHQHNPNASK